MNKNSSFSVAGVIDVRVERFTNSLSEQERETRMQLSEVFI
jgi:hypothetical protein